MGCLNPCSLNREQMPSSKHDGRLQQATCTPAADSSDNDRCNRRVRTSALTSVCTSTMHWNLHTTIHTTISWALGGSLVGSISGDPTDDKDPPKKVTLLGTLELQDLPKTPQGFSRQQRVASTAKHLLNRCH